MTFSVTANPTTQELSDAVNYLLSNFSQTMAINPNTGNITTANYGVVSYLYKYLQIRYADSYDGTVNFSNVSTDRLYYGINNNDSGIESTTPSDYLWLPVVGGFGTTKFVWYNTTGGRQIEIYIGPAKPDLNFIKDTGNAIDLDLLTTAAEDKTDPVAVDNSSQIQALEQAIGMIPQPQLGTMSPQNAENVDITGGTISLSASTATLVPLHIEPGTQPTTLVQGDIWNETTGLYFHNSVYTNQLNLGANTSGTLSNPVITVAGSGATIDASSVKAVLFSLPGWVGDYKEYVIPAATGLALTDNVANYLVVNYNSGSPVYQVITNPALITNSDVVGASLLWREGTDVHFQNINWGLSTASRLNRRLVQTDRYNRASGLIIGESTGNVITLTAGVIWYGVSEIVESAVTSAASNVDFYYHVAGVYTHSTVSTYNNTQYDNGTGLQSLGLGRYAVNWVYRYLDGAGLPKLAYILGTGNYTLAQAVASSIPTPPAILNTMAILVGRIIVKRGAATASQIDSAFTQVFSSSTVTEHNDLLGLQGGTATEYYHLTSAQHSQLNSAPVIKTADYTIVNTDVWIINNKTGSALTLTFPAASSWTGRSITVKNMQAQLVNSASSNIVPIDSVTAGTAILLNVIGNWATMVSDGTNWVIMQAASNNNLLLE